MERHKPVNGALLQLIRSHVSGELTRNNTFMEAAELKSCAHGKNG